MSIKSFFVKPDIRQLGCPLLRLEDCHIRGLSCEHQEVVVCSRNSENFQTFFRKFPKIFKEFRKIQQKKSRTFFSSTRRHFKIRTISTRRPDGTLLAKIRRLSGFLWIVRSLLLVSSGALRARARASRAMKMLKFSSSA